MPVRDQYGRSDTIHERTPSEQTPLPLPSIRLLPVHPPPRERHRQHQIIMRPFAPRLKALIPRQAHANPHRHQFRHQRVHAPDVRIVSVTPFCRRLSRIQAGPAECVEAPLLAGLMQMISAPGIVIGIRRRIVPDEIPVERRQAPFEEWMQKSRCRSCCRSVPSGPVVASEARRNSAAVPRASSSCTRHRRLNAPTGIGRSAGKTASEWYRPCKCSGSRTTEVSSARRALSGRAIACSLRTAPGPRPFDEVPGLNGK